MRVWRLNPAGALDHSYGRGSINIPLTDVPMTIGGYPYRETKAFVHTDNSVWISTEVLAGSRLSFAIYIGPGGSPVRVFPQQRGITKAKLRHDGRLSFYAAAVMETGLGTIPEIYSLDPTGSVESVIYPGPDYLLAPFEYQSDGKLLLALDGEVKRYSTSQLTTQPAPATREVVEFFNSNLNHYFVTANQSEASFVASGGAGPGWTRTGVRFFAWDRTWSNVGVSGVARAQAVYRFYGTPGLGPNSHFYTVSEPEHNIVQRDPGWKFEEVSFYAVEPLGSSCPDATTPIWRVYNNRAVQNDSNHRYVTSEAAQIEMVNKGWVAEGIKLCVGSTSQ